MKIACLLGSPRADGNSARLARKFSDTASELGAEVEVFDLSQLSFGGCRNLFHCKTAGEACGIEDDLTPVLEAVREADVLVLATPVYFTDIASPLKACIDRFFSFFVPDYVTAETKSRLTGHRSLVFIQIRGEPESACADIFPRYQRPFRMLGFSDFHLIRACGVREPRDIEKRQEALGLAEEIAREIAGFVRVSRL